MNEDFGDAPTSYDSAVAASHVVGDLKLGATIDAENPDTLNGGTAVASSPNAVTAGTDNNGTNGDGADEDAITTFPALTTADNAYSLTVPISGASAAGQVCGWVDYNRNGVFDTGERACATFAAGATSVVLNWTGLTGLTTGTNYVRLRASYNTAGVEDPTGRLDSGEVEDYRLTITAPTFNVSKSFAPTTVSAGA
ncbi:GEVED domain-containing protein [Deinococcus aquaticus]|uniref:GEVED domain-containing protein n=1 Tax=Deinococcus aquaticus TaxID=328692 RepID=UPI003620FEB9